MRVEVHIDPDCRETVVTVTAPELTDRIRELVRRLDPGRDGAIPGWREEAVTPLTPADVLRFYAAQKEVFARTAAGDYLIKLRLYELEERLDPSSFVRISHSEIINLRKVTALDLSWAGTIKMTLGDGGEVCWVSRRYVPKIKEALGLKRREAP
ncbi:MAG: LytTR family transcriptional regulator [Clostridia bacterium]|nr:LytTR family transcriptional regulator [Clostridia bacterium]